MDSVLTPTKGCCICGSSLSLHSHHIFPGPDRKRSEARGLKVWICAFHHEQLHMNPNHGIDLQLKSWAQRYYEDHYGTRDDFRKEFRKSYL